MLQHIRSVTGKNIPVYVWDTGYAASSLKMLAPEKYGGFGDVETKARIEAEATGRNVEDVIDEVCSHCRVVLRAFLKLVWV